MKYFIGVALFTVIFFSVQFVHVEYSIANEKKVSDCTKYELEILLAARGMHGGHSSGKGHFFKRHDSRGEQDSDDDEDDEIKKRNEEDEEDEEYDNGYNRSRQRYEDDEDREYWEMINNGG